MMTHIKITKFRLLSIVAPLVLLTTAKAQNLPITDYEIFGFTPQWQDEAMKTHTVEDIFSRYRSPSRPKHWEQKGFDVIRNAEDFKRVFEKEPQGVDFNSKTYILVRLGSYYRLPCLNGCHRIKVSKTAEGKNTLYVDYATNYVTSNLSATRASCTSAPASGTMEHGYKWITIGIENQKNEDGTYQKYDQVILKFVSGEKAFGGPMQVHVTKMDFTPPWLDESSKTSTLTPQLSTPFPALTAARHEEFIESATKSSLIPEYWREQGFDVIRNAEDFTRVFGKAPEGVDFNSKIYVLVRTGPIYGSRFSPSYSLLKCDSTKVSKNKEGKNILEIEYITACWIDSLGIMVSPGTSPITPSVNTNINYRWEMIALERKKNENGTYQEYDEVILKFGKRKI